MAHIAQWNEFWETAAFWAMGDALGVLLFTPLFLRITERDCWQPAWNPSYAGWMTSVAVACLLIFSGLGQLLLGLDVSPLILIPLVVWGAHSHSLSAVSAGMVLIFAGAFGSYLSGTGHYGYLHDQVSIEPWLMVSTLAASSLVVSAGNAERVSAEHLAASQKLHAWLTDSSRTLHGMLEALCREVTDQIDHAACAIALFDPEQHGALRLAAFSGDAAFRTDLTSILETGDCPIHQCTSERKIVDLPEMDKIYGYAALRHAMAPAGLSGIACIPIEDGAAVLGAVCVFIPSGVHRLDKPGWQAAERIAHQSAVMTVRKRDEQALRQRQAERDAERALLRSLIDTNPDMIFVKDLQGLYLICNRAFEEYANKPERELLGKADLEVFGFEDGANYRAHNARMWQADASRRNEEWIVYPDGRRALVDTLKSPLHDAQGNIRGMVGIYRDITRHRELERTLVSITEIRQRSVGQELHDNLGQRLVGIAYLAKALEQKLFAVDSEAAQSAAMVIEHAQDAVAECKHLAQGLVPVELESNGLMAALQGLAARTEALFGITCGFECAQEVLVHDVATALNLYRIAQEATNNAIRHGGAQRVIISLSSDSGKLRLSVRDHGTGFPDPDSTAAFTSGMGIKIMRYRATLISADLQFLTPAEGGIELLVEIRHQDQALSRAVDRRSVAIPGRRRS